MNLLYFLNSAGDLWRSAAEAEWDSYRSRKLVALRSEYLDVFGTHQTPTSELWHASRTHRAHKMGREELGYVAQFQGVQVLTIKKAVLMQKAKSIWTMFFHLFFSELM